MAPTRVSGDLYYDLDGQIGEIKRQLRQREGYPFDPIKLVDHLQAAIEGNFVDRHGQSVVIPSIPADGEVFELTLDQIVNPMEMVRGDGYDPTNWEFVGQQVEPQTRRFKLVRVGYCRNLDEVRKKLIQYGDIPEGQWREAFKKAFPQNDGNGLVGFPDASWVLPNGSAFFPALFEGGGGVALALRLGRQRLPRPLALARCLQVSTGALGDSDLFDPLSPLSLASYC